MVRIRYTLVDSGLLVSKQVVCGEGIFQTKINRVDLNWNVVVEKLKATGEWAAVSNTEKTKSLAVAKLKAKRLLKEQGVKFLEEIRRKKHHE